MTWPTPAPVRPRRDDTLLVARDLEAFFLQAGEHPFFASVTGELMAEGLLLLAGGCPHVALALGRTHLAAARRA